MSFFPLPPSPTRQLLNFPPQAERQSPKHSWRVTWQSPLPASAARSSRHHASYAKPKREHIPNACARHQKKATAAHSKGSSGKGVKCANSCTSVGGCGYLRSSRHIHPAKRSCSCCVSSSVGGSGVDELIWISSGCYLCCCSHLRCWPRNTIGRASSPRSSRWPSRRTSGDS